MNKLVIKMLSYGVKSKGNQVEKGLQETALLFSHEYPKINKKVEIDICVDDRLSEKKKNSSGTLHIAGELELVLN